MKTAIKNPFKRILHFTLFLSVLILPFNSFSQESEETNATSLTSQFQELKSESESYNDYKVIKTYKLNTFWNGVEDTLRLYRNEIVDAKSQITDLKEEITDLNKQLSEVKASLSESESRNDSIGIFGLQLKKSVYNVVVWLIIGGLLFLAGSMFIAFKSNLIATKKSKKDYHDLMEEFDIYRKESREKQMKLGRELQTERNKLEEYKDKMGRKEKAH